MSYKATLCMVSSMCGVVCFICGLFNSVVGLKLSGTHQLLAYAVDVNILGGSAHTVKENAEA